MLPNPTLTNPTMYVNLGLLYLAGMLLKHGAEVAIVDMRDKELDVNLIPVAKVVGFSATTGEIDYAKFLATKLDSFTIIGGPHATLMPEDCSKHFNHFDHVVIGEGEECISQIAKGAMNDSHYHPMPRITDLDALPFPAWKLMPSRRLFSTALFPGERYGKGDLGATIIGSRGCPYDCAFCGNYMRSPVVRRSPESITGEMLALREYYGVTHFRLEDDNISLNKEWLYELCTEISTLNVNWKCHTRADLVTEEVCAWLKDSGCEEVGLGIESADDKVLELMCKGITRRASEKAIRTIKGAGMRSKVYLVSGLPGETSQTVVDNMRFMYTTKPDKWTLSRFTPYPGCDVWRNPEKYGIIITDHDYSHYWNFPDQPVYELKDANATVLNKRYKKLYDWLVTNG